MANMLGIALEPTYVTGVVKSLKVPRSFQVRCNAPERFFTYNKTEVDEEKLEEVFLAVLSTTKRVKTRTGETKIE